MIAISLTVDMLSGSFMPDEFVKFVDVIIISSLFIHIFKIFFDPAIPSANATQASFPDK